LTSVTGDAPAGTTAQGSGRRGNDWQVTVLIVDDHTIAREGLRAMLETSPHIRVVGEAHDGNAAVEQVDTPKPKVVLMDYKMPNLDGLEATRRIKAAHPTVSIIMMSSYEDEAIVVDAIQAGVSGYLVKDSSRELLLHTLLAVASGGMLVKASLLKRVLGAAPQRRSTADPSTMPLAPSEPLTDREAAVLKLIAEGMTNRAIADKLGFAEVTVKKDVQEIIAKLYASDRTHAAIIALRLGMIV
jgi:DNA-binding NarL/FixJ family response regulator